MPALTVWSCLILSSLTTGQEPFVGSGVLANAVPKPPSTNLIFWLRNDAGLFQDTAGTVPTVADGDPVGLWKDQSGVSGDVSQAVALSKPTLKLNIQNGRQVVRFSGSNGMRLTTVGSVAHGIGTGDFWFAAVTARRSTNAFNTALSIGTFSPAFYTQDPATAGHYKMNFYFSGNHRFDTDQALNTFYVNEIARVSGTVKAWLGAGGATPVQEATTFAGVTGSIANAVFYVGDDNANDLFNGDIAELLLYKGAPDQAALENYLTNKYWH